MFMGPDYADISRPLVTLTRKDTPFNWTDAHTQAVRQLKQRLIDYTTLQVPDTSKPFELYTDASGYAIGGILEQAGQPVGFLSQAMTPVQQKYSIYDQELLVLSTAFDKWSHLLRVAKVTAFTDHQALTHLRKLQTSRPLRGRTARWLDFLAEFPDLTITYLQAARHTVADAFSRLPCHSSLQPPPLPSPSPPPLSGSSAPLLLAPAHSYPAHHTRRTQVNYRQLAGIRRRTPRILPQSPPSLSQANESSPDDTEPSAILPVQPAVSATLDWPAAYANCPVFPVSYTTAVQAAGATAQVESCSRLLAFRFVTPFLSVCIHGLWHVCVPQLPEFLTHILYNHHDHVTAGHQGRKKTFLSLSKLYYWPGMRTYTRAYVESCTQCRASKSLNQKPAGLLLQLIIPSSRWSHVSLDFITDLPLTKTCHDSILVLVDSLSKREHFVPAKKTFTAADTVDILADRLIRYHGLPEVLISDRDPRFQSDVWQQLCARFNIKRALSSSYHPQSDGQTERLNRTREQMFRTYIQSDKREWEHLLPALEPAYNTTSHSSTELLPFEVMIGEKPLTAADLDVVGALSPTLTPPMTKLFRQLCDREQSAESHPEGKMSTKALRRCPPPRSGVCGRRQSLAEQQAPSSSDYMS
ncbi:Similar to Transposon MAGGYgagandpolgenehomologues, related [Eimeria praecox]|uniref:Similar to Transposon MAGGYgagandpolgenehomologues, related n=1 Tax=Eimeria praecox TaxID=51316 RepID=U6GL79_9EIME|nr:Similar to Transposon MAGGYgagandpolgenehomologues, related [Eimeria praecox]